MKELETIAKAYSEVPGFARIMWKTVEALHIARYHVEQTAKYKSEHKKPSGTKWARIKYNEATTSERFCVLADVLSCILESITNDEDNYDWMYSVLLEEIEASANGANGSYASAMSRIA